MASSSSRRSLDHDHDHDHDHEIARLSGDDDGDDANGAATKVGPMTKAFVEQLMFKAHIAETSKPASKPPISEVPASGTRPRARMITERIIVPREVNVPVFHVEPENEGLPFEPTMLAAAARAVVTPRPLPSFPFAERRLAAQAANGRAPALLPHAAGFAFAPTFMDLQGPPVPDYLRRGPSGNLRPIALQVAVVLGGLAAAAGAAVLFLFP